MRGPRAVCWPSVRDCQIVEEFYLCFSSVLLNGYVDLPPWFDVSSRAMLFFPCWRSCFVMTDRVDLFCLVP